MISSDNIRIVLTGASGVGKTSLATLLAEQMHLPLIPEIARELCTSMGYQRIGDIPDQERFKQDVLSLQIEKERQFDSFICDRSTIDCWVLWQRWNLCSAMTFDSERYYMQCRDHARSYTRVIYVPPMFACPSDEFRWTEPDYQKQIDRLVRMTLYEWDLLERTYTVKSDGVKQRLSEVESWIADSK